MNELKIYPKFSEKEYVMYENKLHRIESIDIDMNNNKDCYIVKLNYKLDNRTITTEDKLLKLHLVSCSTNMSLVNCEEEITFKDEFGNTHTFMRNIDRISIEF